MIIQTGKYPSEWCTGHIVPIFKAGDNSEPKNYRGITISSCLGKLFSTIINERLVTFLNDNNLQCKEQIDFQKGKRTSDHALTLKTIIDYYKLSHKKVYTCFVDFRAAFDNIWHEGLIYKLSKLQVPIYTVQILKDMYSKILSCQNWKP
jgi:hypothetical protein